MARRPLWRDHLTFALGWAYHLPRHFRHGHVSMPLSTWGRPLGLFAELSGMALGDSCYCPRRLILAASLVRRRRHADFVSRRCRHASEPGPSSSTASTIILAFPHRCTLLRSTIGPILEPLPYALVIQSLANRGPSSFSRPRAPFPSRPSLHCLLLERRW